MKLIYTRLLDIEKKVGTIQTGKGLLAKSIRELFASVRWKWAKGTRTGDASIETVPPMYWRIALAVERAIMT